MAHKQIRLPENTQNTYHYRANFVRKMRYSTGDSHLSLFLSYSESIGCVYTGINRIIYTMQNELSIFFMFHIFLLVLEQLCTFLSFSDKNRVLGT